MEWWQALIMLIAGGIVADMLLSRICRAIVVKAALEQSPEIREKVLGEISKNHKI